MADWKKLLIENPPASDIASSPSSGKVLKVSANGTSVEWADDAGGAFQITGSNAHYTAGSVGIGTTSPSEALHVVGTSKLDTIKIGDSYLLDVSNNYLKLRIANGDYFAIHGGASDTEYFRLTNDGKIGIGTTNPTNKFHINHNSSTTLGLYVAHSANEYSGLAKFYTNSSNNTARSLVEIHNDNSSSTAIIPLKITQDADGTALAITNGKVGIGTTSPVFGLDVRSTGYFATASTVDQLRLGDTTNGKVSSIRAVNDTMQFKPDGSNIKFFIGNTGKIGVGTSSPTKPLTINHASDAWKVAIQHNGSDRILLGTSASTQTISTADASNNLDFSLGGSTKMRLQGTTGNFGINTGNPTEKLHVNGNIKAGSTSRVFFNTNATGIGSSTINQLDVFSFGDMNISTENSSTKINFKPVGTTIGTFTTTGLGIGTSSLSSGAKLHVVGSNSANILKIQGDGSVAGIQITRNGTDFNNISTTTTNLIFATGGSTRMLLNNTGLGIGTSSPQTKLHIATGADTGEYFRGGGSTNSADARVLKITASTTTNVGDTHAINAISATGVLKLQTHNTDRLVATTTGIGIGTSSPVEKLDISAGNIRLDNQQLLTFATTDANSGRVGIQGDESSDFIRFRTDNANRMAITNTGVGIGTLSPAFSLDISNSGGAGIRLVRPSHATTIIESSSLGGLINVETNHAFRLFTNNTERIKVTEAGLVGIGASSPTEKLQVAGNILLPTDASSVSYRLRLTGDSTSEIYASSYDLYYTTSLNHYKISANGLTLRTSDSSRQILLEHSSSNKRIYSTISDFNIYAGHSGAFGFLTAGSTSGYNAIQDVYTDNNTSGLKFNTKASGTDTERMRITTDGKVGINTTSPSKTLDVVGMGKFTTTGGSDTLTLSDGSYTNFILGKSKIVSATSAQWLQFRNHDGSVTFMTIDSVGKVGIGTTNPVHGKLEVRGVANDTTIAIHEDDGTHKAQLHLRSGGNDVKLYTSGSDNKFHIDTESVSKAFTLATDGKVGIGTSSPDTQLIHGKINTSGSDPMLKLEQAGSGDSTLIFNRSSGVHNASIGVLATDGSFNISTQHNIRGAIKLKLDSNSRISLSNNDNGTNNTLYGKQAGYAILNSNTEHNSFYGHQSGYGLQLGRYNSAFGYQSLNSEQHGSYSTALGYKALYAQVHGTVNGDTGNVGVGNMAGFYNVTGSNNTYIGSKSGFGASGQSNSNNTGVGKNALNVITTGGANVALGSGACKQITSGDYNIGLGRDSLEGNTTNSQNIGIGYRANAQVTGNSNIAIGHYAGYNSDSNTYQYSIAIGDYALDATKIGNITGVIGIGYQALTNLTTGLNNTAVGYKSGSSITTSAQNTFIGYESASTNIGDHNVAVGYNALKGSGSNLNNYNTACGSRAMDTVTTGSNNVAIGFDSLGSITTGHDNVAIGFRSGNNIDTADSCVLVGLTSGTTLTNGRRCTIIGDESDVSASGALNQIVIGQGATGIQDNSAIIGNSACADVFMGDNGSAWSTTSDGRLKENIKEWSTGLDAINKLRVVEYNFKEDNPHKYDHKKKRQGIIAQEAIEAIPEMIKDDGEWLSANQEPMIWALVNAVKELTQKVNMLETKLKKEN